MLQNVRFCARIISKCNHINVRSKSRTPKHNFLQQAKIKEYKFVSFPRLSSIHDREILPEDMKSYTEKMKGRKKWVGCVKALEPVIVFFKLCESGESAFISTLLKTKPLKCLNV